MFELLEDNSDVVQISGVLAGRIVFKGDRSNDLQRPKLAGIAMLILRCEREGGQLNAQHEKTLLGWGARHDETEITINRSHFETSDGHRVAGFAPYLEGDIVFLIFGRNLSLILRPAGEYWKLMGLAYVHGVMKVSV